MNSTQKYVHVVQFLNFAGWNESRMAYVKDGTTIVDDPLDAMWFSTYDSASNYKALLLKYGALDKFSYEPGSVSVMTFAVHMACIGEQLTLKSEGWKPTMNQESDKTESEPAEKVVITGKAIPDITDQTLESVEYAVSVGGGLRKFVSDTTYDKVTFRLDEAARYKCFSDALDQAEELRNRQLLDIQIHEIKTEVKVGRTVTL